MHPSSPLKSEWTPAGSAGNPLATYIQSLSPEEISRLSRPPEQAAPSDGRQYYGDVGNPAGAGI